MFEGFFYQSILNELIRGSDMKGDNFIRTMLILQLPLQELLKKVMIAVPLLLVIAQTAASVCVEELMFQTGLNPLTDPSGG